MRRARRTATIVSRILPTQSGHDRYPYRQGDCRSFSVTRAELAGQRQVPQRQARPRAQHRRRATWASMSPDGNDLAWELYRANVTECIVARLIRFERPLIGPRGDRNGSITPVHHLQELSLAPLPTSVVATVSANGCSGEWDPVRPRISTVCSHLASGRSQRRLQRARKSSTMAGHGSSGGEPSGRCIAHSGHRGAKGGYRQQSRR